MKTKDDRVFLHHIFEAIQRIKEYTKHLSYEDFLNNNLVQDATIRQIEIIGEATKHISEKFRNIHKTIPWRDIAGMRDKLIHGYFGVDLDAVWKTVTEDIPFLEEQFHEIYIQ